MMLKLVRPRQGPADRAQDERGFGEMLRPGIPIPRYSQLRMGLPSGRALMQAWQRSRPDIVHIATEGPLGWSALSAARALGLPVATDFRTNFRRLQQPLRFRLDRARSHRLPARLPQPRRLHHGADRGNGAEPRATGLPEPARGGARREHVGVHAIAARPGAAPVVVRPRRRPGRALREPIRAGEEFPAGLRRLPRDARGASRRPGSSWWARARSPRI